MHFLLIALSLLSCLGISAAEPLLDTAQAILNQPDSSYQNHTRFELRGQVLSCTTHNFTFRDSSGTISIQAPGELLGNVRPGNFIHAVGELFISALGINDKRATSIEVTGFAPAPELQDVTAGQIDSGIYVYQRVRVTGTLASVSRDEMDYKYLWLMLRTNEGTIPAAIPDSSNVFARVSALIDGEISLCGTLQRVSAWTRPFPYFLSCDAGLSELTVRQQPLADPFAAPLLATSHTLHRQRATGVVLAVSDNHFYLHTPWRRQLKVIPADGHPLPRAGDAVTAIGFAEGNQYNLRLVDALIRPEASVEVSSPTPQALTVEELFTDSSDERNLNVHHNGRLITVEGDLPYVPDGEFVRLTLECGSHPLTLDLSGIASAELRHLESGVRIKATGLCLAEFDNDDSSALFPRFRRFKILPRSAADLEVIRSAPWWTPQKLLAVIGILLSVLFGALVWLRSLHILSNRRGAQLFAEQIDHARSELKVEERTRLAVELHDNLAQTLTAVNLHIETARRFGSEAHPELLTHLDIADKTLNSCREELRNCLWDLRSEALESDDMATAIRQALKPNTENCQLQIRFAVPRDLLTDKTAHSILCILRELAINAIRHGRATALKIAGSIEDNILRFSVRDNGCGFDPTSAPGIREGHFGLQGIRERVGQLNGSFIIEKDTGGGTRAEVSVRLSPIHRES